MMRGIVRSGRAVASTMMTAAPSFRWIRLIACIATLLVAIAIFGAAGLLSDPFLPSLNALVELHPPGTGRSLHGKALASGMRTETVGQPMAAVKLPDDASSASSQSAVATPTVSRNFPAAGVSLFVQLTPSPAPEGQFDAYVTFLVANLRSGPGNGYPNLQSYSRGTGLLIISRNAAGNWVKVETPDGRQGWMNVLLLQVNRSLDEIPVDREFPNSRPVMVVTPSLTPQPSQGLEPTRTPVLPAGTPPATAAPEASPGLTPRPRAGEMVALPTALPASSSPTVLPVSPPATSPIFLLTPTDGLLLSGGQHQFVWQAAGSLNDDEYFILDIWPYDSEPRPAVTTRENSWTGTLDLSPGIYSWRVRRVSDAGGGVVERTTSETYTFAWRP